MLEIASDSATIRVTGVAGAAVTEIDLSSTPHTIIGSSARPEYEFHQVAGLAPLDNGGVAVIDASRQLRYFDGDGRLVTSVGRPGEGPGEFANPVSIQRIGDWLAVVDLGLARVSLFDQRGNFSGVLRAPSLPRPEPRQNVLGSVPASIVGILADSTLVVQGPSFFLSEGSPGWRDVVGALRLVGPGGEVVAELGDVAVMQYLESPGEAMPIRTSSHAPMLSIDALGGRVAVTTGDAYEITVHHADGRSIDYREDRERLPAPDRNRPDDRPYTPLQPAYAEVRLDPGGAILVREYQLDSSRGQLWTILESNGTVRGRYRMPPGFRLERPWNRLLYGVWTDALGVERIGWIEH